MTNISDADTGGAAEQIGASPPPPVISLPNLPFGGMEHAKEVLSNYLADNLPSFCLALRDILGVADPTSVQNLLPIPAVFLPYEPPALDASNLATSYAEGATALCYVSCLRMNRFQMLNYGPQGDPEWRASYAMSVITWIKGQAWQDTIAASNNLITAVRACLMRRMGLDNPDFIRIDPNSYTEQAMEPEVLQGNRHARAAAASFTMNLYETLQGVPLGTVREVVEQTTILSSFSTMPNPAIHPGPFSP